MKGVPGRDSPLSVSLSAARRSTRSHLAPTALASTRRGRGMGSGGRLREPSGEPSSTDFQAMRSPYEHSRYVFDLAFGYSEQRRATSRASSPRASQLPTAAH